MPSGFTKMFADRLNGICKVTVKEAQHNDYLRIGEVLIAPAGKHMAINLSGGKLMVECFDGEKVHGVIPAADILFKSAAKQYGSSLAAVVLTGMGNDGAEGIKEIKQLGGTTIAQDEASSMIFSMPKAAIDTGCIDMILPLHDIAIKLLSLCD
jgi:two-component system chemotaxis response regulator CheB